MDILPNPWKMPLLGEDEYAKIRLAYRLAPFPRDLAGQATFAKRGLVVGHEGFDRWLSAANGGKRVALVSGFMASGRLHLGNLATLRQVKFYQDAFNASVFIPIADLEAACVRKTPTATVERLAADFLGDFFAIGLDPSQCHVYEQSWNLDLLRLASRLSGEFGPGELDAIYGRSLSLGEAFCSLVMAADILLPQTLGFDETLVVLGVDEIAHFMLTKDVVRRLPTFRVPAITYHKMIAGLRGTKMGKSVPTDSILLSDPPDTAANKLRTLLDMPPERSLNTALHILSWFGADEDLVQRIKAAEDLARARTMACEAAMSTVEGILAEHQREGVRSKHQAEAARQLLAARRSLNGRLAVVGLGSRTQETSL